MLDPIEQRIVDDVAKHGWHIIAVNPSPQGPGFAYSIAMMETLDHPEMIIFGLERRLMSAILTYIRNEIRSGRPFREPGLYEGLIDGFACKFARVAPRFHSTYLGYSMWHRRHVGKIGTLAAMQCLWPDKKGIFPDEAGCDTGIIRRQPVLSENA